ncbi:predicted protein [Histoplasma mississippiense (nom. inval.)]|nr:predicted protein [Histoplasma mississippiense (nom. inval.)]EDN07328.1 predicted protein [Histoplasma mississippiense (nom. inval.)]
MMRIASVPFYAFVLLASIQPILAKRMLERPIFRQSTNLRETAIRDAFSLLRIGYGVEKRTASPQQDAPSRSATEQNPPTGTSGLAPPPVFDEQKFNAAADKACLKALDDLVTVVNPSGMAACFNIPYFDNKTGAFEADIRVYKLTEAVGEFAGIPLSEYALKMNIPQATISNPRRLVDKTRNDQGEVKLLEEFRNFGQISRQLQVNKLTKDDIRVLLIPNITVGASNPQNQKSVITTLSSDTLSYVAGFFTNKDNSPVNITMPDANSRLPGIVAAATAFVLPGTTLGIFPTGLIITSAWAGVFLGAVGYGTIIRMKFRDHYRRRLRMAEARAEGNVRI